MTPFAPERPLLTIVVTTFHDADGLRRTLESVAAQQNYERTQVQVVVSDGGSTDDTPRVISEFADVIDRVRSEKDRGPFDGMNLGADLATGKWLHFLNSGDTFVGAGALAALLAGLERASLSRARWVIGGAVHVDPKSGRQKVIPNRPHRWRRHALGLQPHCHQATWVCTETHRALGGFELERGFVADHAMVMRLGRLGDPVVLEELLIAYLGGGMSEVRMDEVPGALHQNRVAVLGLGVFSSSVDRILTVLLAAYGRGRRRLGKALGR